MTCICFSARVLCGPDSPGRGHSRPGSRKKPALCKRGLVSLPRVQAGFVLFWVQWCLLTYALCLKMVLLHCSCTESFDGRRAFDARLRGSPRFVWLVPGRLMCQGFDLGWHRQSASRSFRDSNKRRLPALDFERSRWKSSFAQPTACCSFLGPGCCFGQSFGLPSISKKYLPRWLQNRVNASAREVVEFHLLVVPMGWNWFVQQMLEHVVAKRLCDTSHQLHIGQFCCVLALSQAEDELLTRVLERLEIAGEVAMAEPSSDALWGFELSDSGTRWRPSSKKFWRLALALRERAFGRAPGHAMSLCLDHGVSFTACSSLLASL